MSCNMKKGERNLFLHVHEQHRPVETVGLCFGIVKVCLSLVEVTSSFVLLSKGVSREDTLLSRARCIRSHRGPTADDDRA